MSTIGKAITLVELDVDLFRSTQFELGVVGEEPANWMSLWASNVALEVVELADSPSGKAMQLTRTGGDALSMATWTLVPNLTDVSIVARLRDNISGTVNSLSVVARADDASSGYRLQLGPPYTLSIIRSDLGVETTLVSEDYYWDPQVDYWMRFDVITQDTGDVLLRAKVWTGEIEDEPDDFTISVTDAASDLPHASGSVGVFLFYEAGIVQCSYFRARSVFGSTVETLRFCKPSI